MSNDTVKDETVPHIYLMTSAQATIALKVTRLLHFNLYVRNSHSNFKPQLVQAFWHFIIAEFALTMSTGRPKMFAEHLVGKKCSLVTGSSGFWEFESTSYFTNVGLG